MRSLSVALTLLIALMLSFVSHAAEWHVYPYTSTYRAARQMGGRLYLLKSNSLLLADPDTWQITRELTRQDGLSGTEIIDIIYSPTAQRLAVVYADGMIDLIMPDGAIWTIPDYSNAPMQGTDKQIIAVREQQGLLFLMTAYGFAVVDLQKEVFLHNFVLQEPVRCAWSHDGIWYYSNARGTFACPQSANPFAPDAWQPVSDVVVLQALVFHRAQTEQCWLLSAEGNICRITSRSHLIEPCTDTADITGLYHCPPYLFATSPLQLSMYDTRSGQCPALGESPRKGQLRTLALDPSWQGICGFAPMSDDSQHLALLQSELGLRALSLTLTDEHQFSFVELQPAPLTVDNHQQSPRINRLSLGIGSEVGMSHVPTLQTPYASMMTTRSFLTSHDEATGQWLNVDASMVANAIEQGNQRFVGITDFIADATRSSRYWFASLEDGIIGIDHGQFLTRYNHATTEGELQECAYLCTRVGSLAVSPMGDLWCTNEGVPSILKVRRAFDGKWHSFTIPGLEMSYGFTHLLHSRTRHQVWGVQQFTYQQSNVFVYDYGNSIDDLSDDRVTYFRELIASDTLGSASTSSFIPYYGRGVYESPSGVIYLLNTSGLFAVDRPEAIFDHPGEVRTLLDGVVPTSLAFDEQGHLWVSTEADGLYLLSADGRQQLDHITTSNSLLPTDEVLSLAFDAQHSTLWMATTGQLLSYTYEADEYEARDWTTQAYCYPSRIPVGSRSVVNAFGLRDDTKASLLNSQGHLLQQTLALGHHASFTTDGLPVGTYTIAGTDQEGHNGSLITFEVTE